MQIKLFWKKNCPKCPEAKSVLERMGLAYTDYDLEDVNGLTEAAFHSILTTPSILMVNEQGQEVFSWRGQIPSPKEIRQHYH